MKFSKNTTFILIIVDVSASTGAFVGTVCLWHPLFSYGYSYKASCARLR